MAKLLEEWKEDLVEALTEHDSQQAPEDRACGAARANIAVGAALVLFIASLLHAPMEALLKGIAYFLARRHISLRDRPADRLLHGEGAAQGAVHGLLLRADVHSAGAELSA